MDEQQFWWGNITQSQIAIGDHINQTWIQQLGEPTPQDIPEIQQALEEIKAEILKTGLAPDKRGLAEYQIEQIQDELSKKPGSLNFENLRKAVEWIIKFVPSGLKLLKDLFALSAVARILAPTGEQVLHWVKTIFDQ